LVVVFFFLLAMSLPPVFQAFSRGRRDVRRPAG